MIPIVLAWGALEYFYRHVESNYSYKHKMVTTHYDEIETLVLGDSHAFFGINPEFITSEAFNLSLISQSLYFDELLFSKHQDSLKNLKNLVLTIGYYTLSQPKNVKGDTWRKYFYYNQMDIKAPIVSDFDIRKYSLALCRRFSWSTDLLRKYIQDGTIVSCDENGWGNYYIDKGKLTLQKHALQRAKGHKDGLMDFSQNTIKLQSIIDRCKTIGCKVYLVEMPVHKDYITALNPEKWNKIESVCKTLESNNRNTTYINLREDYRLEDSDLYDADHLNHKGAKKYTQIINEIISDPKNGF
ncbi:hypothetical protein [Aquimarina rubra]|uniref:SGNH/GDSL hydrolase family protein n=1 Tax=Aquimarina rubra TaxID=1920033 RepID=A0ABW5LL64_9FLAO